MVEELCLLISLHHQSVHVHVKVKQPGGGGVGVVEWGWGSGCGCGVGNGGGGGCSIHCIQLRMCRYNGFCNLSPQVLSLPTFLLLLHCTREGDGEK